MFYMLTPGSPFSSMHPPHPSPLLHPLTVGVKKESIIRCPKRPLRFCINSNKLSTLPTNRTDLIPPTERGGEGERESYLKPSESLLCATHSPTLPGYPCPAEDYINQKVLGYSFQFCALALYAISLSPPLSLIHIYYMVYIWHFFPILWSTLHSTLWLVCVSVWGGKHSGFHMPGMPHFCALSSP